MLSLQWRAPRLPLVLTDFGILTGDASLLPPCPRAQDRLVEGLSRVPT